MKTRRTILCGLFAVIFTLTLALATIACEGPTDDGGTPGTTPGTTPGGNTPTAPAITATSLPDGIEGTVYSQTLTATGTAPITWSLESGGALPAGLTLSGTGNISGTPTTEGTYTFTVKAANAAGSATQALSITVLPAYAALYGKWVSTTGQYQPYTLTITAGTIRIEDKDGDFVQYADVQWGAETENTNAANKTNYPNGFTFTGTRTNDYYSTTFGFVALSADGQSVYVGTNASSALSALGGPIYTTLAPVITTASLPNGTVGTAYSQTLAATNPPITWTIESGALPAGLTLSTGGAITGTPTAEGTSAFTVKAANDAGSATKSLSITIASSGGGGDGDGDDDGDDDGMEFIAVSNSTFGSTGNDIINAIAYGGGRFVAVGRYGRMAYSTNGTSWTAVADSTFTASNINGIAYGDGKFVAVGSDSKMAYSTNGTSWTAVADSKFGSSAIYGIAYGDGKFVAVGDSGKMAYSTNGISWTAVADSKFNMTNNNLIRDVAYGGSGINARFIAVGSNFYANMATSTNGTSWTAVDSTFGTNPICGIAYGGGRWVAVGSNGKMAYSTTNGTSWAAVADSKFGSSVIYGIAYEEGMFIAVGESGKMASSPDGTNWTAVADSKFGTTEIYGIAYGDSKFVAVGREGKMAYSAVTWTATSNNTITTSSINFTFSAAVTGLTAGDITVTNRTGSVTKGALTGSGASWSLAVSNVTAGNVTVSINKDGIQSGNKTVAVYKATDGTPREVTIAMWDYGTSGTGDGWDDNAALRINVNGTNRSNNASVSKTADNNTPSGQRSTNTYTFNVNPGDEVRIYWVSGGTYDRECAFAAYYSDNPPNPMFNPSTGTTDTARVLASKQYNIPAAAVGNGTSMGSFTVTVGTPTAPAIITTSPLPNGRAGTEYSQNLSATGGSITWSIESGSALPAGLSLSASGVISGTPTAAGTFTFTVKAANSAGSITKELSITIASPVTYTAAANNSTYNSNYTTAITFTFSETVTGLSSGDITITNGTGSATKGTLTGSGTTRSLAVTNVSAGDITVSINKGGIESGTKTVTVSNTIITYTVTADGNSTTATTAITFTFSGTVTGLTASNITITNGTGSATKGTLTGSGTTRTLAVTNVSAGNVTVGINVAGIETATKDVTLYKPVTYTAASNGRSTTAITFTFSGTVTGLTAGDITVTNGTGSATKGTLTGSGTSWSLAVTNVSTGNITVSINRAGIESGNKTVAVAVYDTTWTAVSNSTFGTNQIYAIAYGNNRFVAVGYNGRMAYSDNGTTWTSVSYNIFGTSTGIYGIAYGGSRFVAVGDGGRMAYSEDNGTTWTSVSNTTFTGADDSISAIAYGGSRWVAVGGYGKMATSTNGTSWTAVSNTTFGATLSDSIRGIAYGNNRWVAVGSKGKIAYSDNGTSWTAVANSTFGTSDSIRGIAYGNGRWVAVGYGKMAYSDDNGVTWTSVANSTFGTSDVINGIAYGGGRFVAVGDGGKMAYSIDGITWRAASNSIFGTSDYIFGIAYGGSRFVIVGSGGKMAYSSMDFIPLTANQWANGSIPTSSGEQWFIFTATASTQYIHFSTTGTLKDVYVQVYASNGTTTVGSETNLYGSTTSTSRTLTSGQMYYIRVWPYGSGDGISGTYRIGFNGSTTAPN